MGFILWKDVESLLRSKNWLITVDDSCLRKSHQRAIPIVTGICNGKWKHILYIYIYIYNLGQYTTSNDNI